MNDGEDRLKAARELLQQGDFAGGLAEAQTLLSRDPGDADDTLRAAG